MDFSDALRAVRDGYRVRRALWLELGGRVGSWVELAKPGPTDDGLRFPEVLICPRAGSSEAGLFACSQRDILAVDWEIVPDGDPG